MPISLRGLVVHGAGEGRATGYPTANLALADGSARPSPGIYACWVDYNGKRFPGALVSGVHQENNLPRVEVYLIDFSGDLYGAELKVTVDKHIRDIEKYSQVETLKDRIAKDIAEVKAALQV